MEQRSLRELRRGASVHDDLRGGDGVHLSRLRLPSVSGHAVSGPIGRARAVTVPSSMFRTMPIADHLSRCAGHQPSAWASGVSGASKLAPPFASGPAAQTHRGHARTWRAPQPSSNGEPSRLAPLEKLPAPSRAVDVRAGHDVRPALRPLAGQRPASAELQPPSKLPVRPSRVHPHIPHIRVPTPSLSPERQGSPQKRTRADRGSPPTEDEDERAVPTPPVLHASWHAGRRLSGATRYTAEPATAAALLSQHDIRPDEARGVSPRAAADTSAASSLPAPADAARPGDDGAAAAVRLRKPPRKKLPRAGLLPPAGSGAPDAPAPSGRAARHAAQPSTHDGAAALAREPCGEASPRADPPAECGCTQQGEPLAASAALALTNWDAGGSFSSRPFSPPVVPISARLVRAKEGAKGSGSPRWPVPALPCAGHSVSAAGVGQNVAGARAATSAASAALTTRETGGAQRPISLRYDATLQCYFDPTTCKYYELV